MALLGQAALAMWWDMAPEMRSEFEDWHSHEHLAERMAIPGFLRGTRWRSASGGDGVFVLYELEQPATLGSPRYLARLNAPTPWSTTLMPHHRGMVRSQCAVVGSSGGGVAAHAATLRLAPSAGRAEALRDALLSRLGTLAATPGLTGAHLLRHAPPAIAATTEQRIRGHADKAAEWVLIVCGYELQALAAALAAARSLHASARQDGAGDPVAGLYSLSHSAAPEDSRAGSQLSARSSTARKRNLL